MNLKKFSLVFVLGFIFNIVWENLHSNLYVHYKGAAITEFILVRAAFFDAVFIVLAFIVVYNLPILKNKLFWLIIISLGSAIFIELNALSTNRWAYKTAMPIIPILGIGLTPTIQLALITSIIYKITKKRRINN